MRTVSRARGRAVRGVLGRGVFGGTGEDFRARGVAEVVRGVSRERRERVRRLLRDGQVSRTDRVQALTRARALGRAR